MLSSFDTIIDAFIEAAASDLSRPETKKALREHLDVFVSRLLGININNPFVKPVYEQLIKDRFNNLYELMGVVVSDPPNSIDESASMIKEEANTKIDDFKERLKKRLNKEQ